MTDPQPLRTPPASKGRSPAVASALVIEGRDGARQVIALGTEEIVLGRGGQGVNVRLQERDISRRHATFSFVNGAVWVEDLGSSNGTRVNGERIQGKRRIREGDLVQIGGYDIAVLETAELPQTPVAPEQPPDLAKLSPPPIGARAVPPSTPPVLPPSVGAIPEPIVDPQAPRPTATPVPPAVPSASPPLVVDELAPAAAAPRPAPVPLVSAAVVPAAVPDTSRANTGKHGSIATPAASVPRAPQRARPPSQRPAEPVRRRAVERPHQKRSSAAWVLALMAVGVAALFLGWAAGRFARMAIPSEETSAKVQR